ncbi:aromatic ring-hydroxylating oxygenase subunit alpha [Sphingopyxis sp. J-6]|uniref:aromatic ring-hydroxylating oxygenase subunit alpha n=1 Tax=unclassified Sphingopyxis TaxID=2614943 RepID=UPI003984129B
MQLDQSQYVSSDGAQVRRSIYSDEAVYRRELEEIFSKRWLLVGHESQLSTKSSYFTSFMGEDPVVVTRGSDGKINVFLNACSHRGARICLDDSGEASRLVCPYHAWTFAMDGQLVGVPLNNRLYGGLNKEAFGLKCVAQVEEMFGLIFATFASDAPPLRDELGGLIPFLEAIFARTPSGVTLVGKPQKWRVPTNWKVYSDNFAGDEYHVGSTHGSAVETIGLDWDTYLRGIMHCALPGGHGFAGHFHFPDGVERPYTPVEQPDMLSPATQAYYQSVVDKLDERVSPIHGRCQWVAGNVFPNWSLLPVFNTFRIAHPKGPGEIELWSYVYVDKEAPDDVRRELSKFYNFNFGPAGIIEQDDSAVWESIYVSSKGQQGRDAISHFHMGLGNEAWHEGLGCFVTDQLSEAAQRNFYKQWASAIGTRS